MLGLCCRRHAQSAWVAPHTRLAMPPHTHSVAPWNAFCICNDQLWSPVRRTNTHTHTNARAQSPLNLRKTVLPHWKQAYRYPCALITLIQVLIWFPHNASQLQDAPYITDAHVTCTTWAPLWRSWPGCGHDVLWAISRNVHDLMRNKHGSYWKVNRV
jgi:hypothetical protein